MKKILIPVVLITLFSCKKNVETTETKMADTLAKIDSINAARTKYNDSIKILNDKNRFADLSGTHQLSYTGDNAKFSGTVEMSKTGQDEYDVKGSASSSANRLNLDGKIKRVSAKHLNFEGKISQKIGGSSYTRTRKTTFLDEGKGNYWRLQDKVNGDGFIEYIDIHK